MKIEVVREIEKIIRKYDLKEFTIIDSDCIRWEWDGNELVQSDQLRRRAWNV